MKNGLQDMPENGEKLRNVSIRIGPTVNELITFDQELTNKLRHDYNEAVHLEYHSFWFEGQELLTVYAKYLLEYLDDKLT